MKKLIALVMAAVMAFALVGCGAPATPAAAAPAAPEAAPAGAEAPAAPEGKAYKVAMICDSSISDGGWGMSCYNAMIDAAEKNGWETAYSDSIDQAAYYDSIVSYCSLGYDLIYAPGNQYTDAVMQAAEEYPDIAFALLNGAATTPEKAANKNVTSLLPNAQQIGWIAGALAGLMTESGTIAFIGGMELDTTLNKYKGYVEAATFVGKEAGKEIKALEPVYAGSFSDTAKGMEFANTMIEQGADVFFGDASAVDSGARQAIDGYNKAQGSLKVYDIAQPADLLGQNECIIGSQVTDNSSLVGLCMEAIKAGNFGGEVIYGTLQNGALSAGKTAEWLDAGVVEQYEAYIQQMVDDTFMK